jgi:hypothetical protein
VLADTTNKLQARQKSGLSPTIQANSSQKTVGFSALMKFTKFYTLHVPIIDVVLEIFQMADLRGRIPPLNFFF